MTKAQETKSFSAAATKVIDADQGIVEHFIAVYGNIDRGADVLHPGSFSKSIMERGLKVKVLDQHNTSSVRNIVGKPLELREVGRLELPKELIDEYPDAVGALKAKTQFLLDTEEGLGVFKRIKSGAATEYSIGYDPIVQDYSTVETEEGKQTIRNLRECRLWEYSSVVFAMNPGATTISAKQQAGPEDDKQPAESKPYNVFEQDGEYCVYKIDEGTGEPVGESLGCHESVDEAEAQMAALYASEEMASDEPPETAEAEPPEEEKAPMKTEADGPHPADHYLIVEDAEKVSTWHLRIRNAEGDLDHRLMGAAWASLHGGYRGNVYEGPGKRQAVSKLRQLYEQEDMDTPKADEGPEVIVDGVHYVQERYVGGEVKVGRVLAARNIRRLEAALATITEVLKDAGLLGEEEDAEEKQDHNAPAGQQAADDTPAEPEAGPEVPPTSERMALLRKLQIELLEVDQP